MLVAEAEAAAGSDDGRQDQSNDRELERLAVEYCREHAEAKGIALVVTADVSQDLEIFDFELPRMHIP